MLLSQEEAIEQIAAPLCVTLPEGPVQRLDKALSLAVPEGAGLSRSRLGRLIERGCVHVDGQPISDLRTKTTGGVEICIYIDTPKPLEMVAENIALDVVYEDQDLIVINKAAGMVVHPAPGSPCGTLVNALLYHWGAGLSHVGGGARPGIVHRIDKDTSGLLVVAKTDQAHQTLAAQFSCHSVARRYLALTHGVPDVGNPRLRGLRGIVAEAGGILRVETLLARHKYDRQRQAVHWHNGRHAITRLRVIEAFADQAALAECWLETGRTHQIRVHMTYAGHSLLGDQVYGGRQKIAPKALGVSAAEAGNGFLRQALHAATLGFDHPRTAERLEFVAPLPADFEALLGVLRAAER